MFTVALLPYDTVSRGAYLCNRDLPANYMGDFTLMGFLVDHYQAALALLTSSGYRVAEQQAGADIFIDAPRRLPEITAFLAAHNIRCDLADIADTLYQA